MKRLGIFAACCALAASLAFALTGCSGSSEAYEPKGKDPVVTTPTIGKSGVLRVGVDTSNSPLAGQASQIVGIDVDIAAAIADELGLTVEIIDVGTNPLSALQAGTVDIVMGIDESNTDAAMWKSEAYLPTAIALFASSKDAAVPTSTSQSKIAAQASSTSAWAVGNEFGTTNLVTETKLKSAFAALKAGTVNYVAADAVIGTYAAYTDGVPAYIVGLLQQPSGYSIGVLSSNSALRQSVSTTLETLMNNGIVSVIEQKWLGTTLDLSSTPLTAGAKSAKSNTKSTTEGSEQTASSAESDANKTSQGEGGSTTSNATGTNAPSSSQNAA